MTTTAYNHSILGTAQRPLIPNEEFKNMLDQVKKNNSAAYEDACKKYSLEPYQHQLVQHELIVNVFKF